MKNRDDVALDICRELWGKDWMEKVGSKLLEDRIIEALRNRDEEWMMLVDEMKEIMKGCNASACSVCENCADKILKALPKIEKVRKEIGS